MLRNMMTGAVVALVVASGADAQGPDWLTFTEDESAVERDLLAHFADSREWVFEVLEFSSDDIYLSRTFDIDGVEADIDIDVLADGTTGHRVIRLSGWVPTGIQPDDPRRTAVLEAMNEGQHSGLGPSIYLDVDGDFTYEWLITLPADETPVHVNQVAGAVDRIVAGLRDTFLPALREAGVDPGSPPDASFGAEVEVVPPPPELAEDPAWLTFTPDEGAIERQLLEYLANRRGWVFEASEFGSGDIYLSRTFDAGDVAVDIDIDVLSDDNTGNRVIYIHGWLPTGIREHHPARRAALDALNAGLHTAAGPSVYLDVDGDLAYEWLISLRNDGSAVHANQVAGGIDRILAGLEGTFLPALRDAGIDPTGPTPIEIVPPPQELAENPDWLGYTLDESEIERQLLAYFARTRNWTFDVHEFGADDIYLVHTFTIGGVPVAVNIDVLTADATAARIIRLHGWLPTGIHDGHPQRRAALDALNTGLHTALGPAIYLDYDGDVTYEWLITLRNDGSAVHANQVASAVERMLAGLETTFLPALRDAGIDPAGSAGATASDDDTIDDGAPPDGARPGLSFPDWLFGR